MKKITHLFAILLVIIGLCLSQVTLVAAEDSQEFPYEGIYVTDEDRAVQAYIFAPNSIYLIYNRNNYYQKRNSERIVNLINFSTDTLTGSIDPSQSAEDIDTKREELGLNQTFKEKLTEIVKNLPDDATFQDFELAFDGQFQRIVFGSHLFDLYFVDHIKLASPQLDLRNEDEWVVRMYQQRLLSIKPGPEEGTIVDDYKGLYRKVEDIFQINQREVTTDE